ncbi:hypothetical protein PoB_002035900 [Plakobranchus ocellatus]|uniref:Uncharacterized protein n=1 Tax=Plakobranchus ocellatus TaxID=259542 RepID=A0AAV3ZEP5_9GAST|nr:hypothetical protein PoB_002035900 [Plakobranchus ocellatus]
MIDTEMVLVIVVAIVVWQAGRLGRAVCFGAKTIDFAVAPICLILVTNSIAKPGLKRTCLTNIGATGDLVLRRDFNN